MRKKSKLILVAVTVFLLLVVGGAAWLYVELDRASRPKPPTEALPMLVRDLPRQTIDIRPEFQRRVRAQYPDGMGAAALSEDLRQKGFHINKRQTGLEIAVLEQHTLVCTYTWVISWKPDTQGRARDIGANFNLGCL